MPIGERLKEERERLRLSQPAFATIAGTTKQTLFSWESGKTAPDGFQLALLAEAGVDVLYVLTGEYVGGAKPEPALTQDETSMLTYYREATREVQRAALGALLGAAQPTGDVHMVNLGSRGSVQIGLMTGGKVKTPK